MEEGVCNLSSCISGHVVIGRDFEGTLREVKIGRSNSDIGLSVRLQSNVVFEQLR